MLSRPTLVNIALFMEGVTVSGKQALLAWGETYQAVVAEINAIDRAAQQPPVNNAHVAIGCEQFGGPA